MENNRFQIDTIVVFQRKNNNLIFNKSNIMIIPYTYKSQRYTVEISETETVEHLFTKISSGLRIERFNIYYQGQRLYPSGKTLDILFQNNQDLCLKVIPSLSKRSYDLGSDKDSRKIILERYLTLISSTSDSVGNVVIAKKLLKPDKKNESICDIFTNSRGSTEISAYIYSLFKRDIITSMTHKMLSDFYCTCSDIRFLGTLMNQLAEYHKEAKTSNIIVQLIENIKIDSKFFELLENTNFANRTLFYEAVFSRLFKDKVNILTYSNSLIVFVNNSNLNDTEFFKKYYTLIKDKKVIKYKQSNEMKLLLLSISIKADKLQEVAKKYIPLLTEMVPNLKFSKAVISTLYSLLQYSKAQKNNSLVTPALIKQIIDKLPNEYPNSDLIQQLISDHYRNHTGSICDEKSDDQSQLSYSSLLLFSYTLDFHLIWSMKNVRLLCHTLKFCDLLKSNFSYIELYNSIASSSSDRNIKSLGSEIGSFVNIITSNMLEVNSNAHTLPTGYSYYDSVFNLLLILIEALFTNKQLSVINVNLIVEFAFLYLFRPNLTMQKNALSILYMIEESFNTHEKADQQIKKEEVCIYTQIKNFMADPSFADLTESCRIFRAALSFISKSSSGFKNDVYRIALLTEAQHADVKVYNNNSAIILPEKSFTVFILKIVLKKINPDMEPYSIVIQSRLEFISIAFSFLWSISGTFFNYTQKLLSYLSQTGSLADSEKMDVLFRFIQKENKKEQRHNSCSFISFSQSNNISNSSQRPIQRKKSTPLKEAVRSSNTLQSQDDEEEDDDATKKKICEVITRLQKPHFPEGYSLDCFKYFFILSRLITNESFIDFCRSVFGKETVLIIDSKLQRYETIRHFFFMILVSVNDERAFFLLPQMSERFIVEYIQANPQKKKLFTKLLRTFLIYDEKTLKKAILMALSLKLSSEIPYNNSIEDLLSKYSSLAIQTLFLIISNSRISKERAKFVVNKINILLEAQLPLNSKIVSNLHGTRIDNLILLYDTTKKYINQYLPLFLITDVFNLDVWAHIYDDNPIMVLNSIISVFSSGSMDVKQTAYFQNKMKQIENDIPDTAYRLFELYSKQQDKAWQVIVLSFLFDKPNKFVKDQLLTIFKDTDKLESINSIEKSSVSACFDHPIEDLLDNDQNIFSVILRILPCVRSMKQFDRLFSIIQNSNVKFTKDDLKLPIMYYCSIHPSLVSPTIFIEYLINQINDVTALTNLMSKYKSNPLIRQKAYESIIKLDPNFHDDLT